MKKIKKIAKKVKRISTLKKANDVAIRGLCQFAGGDFGRCLFQAAGLGPVYQVAGCIIGAGIGDIGGKQISGNINGCINAVEEAKREVKAMEEMKKEEETENEK